MKQLMNKICNSGNVISLTFCLVVTVIGGCKSLDPTKDLEEVEVGIYGGLGSWDVSVTALSLAVMEAGYEYQEFNEIDVFNNDISRFRMIIMPGGNPQDYSSALGSIGMKRIQNFVKFGGGYFGVGAGASIADMDSLVWGGIGIFNGDSVWPINQIAQYPETVLTEILKTEVDHDVSRGSADKFTTLYRWGPYFVPYHPDNFSTIYNYSITGSPAMVSFTYGSGIVVLTGCQFEIEENDERDGGDFGNNLYDPETEWELINNSIKFCMSDLF